MLLLNRWREVVARNPNAPALHDLALRRCWSFAELDAAARRLPSPAGPAACPTGNGSDFILATLRAWQSGHIVCPVEVGHAAPITPTPPSGIVHLKTTSASTGPARTVLFTAEQLAADAGNIVSTMGLRPDWPNLAAISLAHSYGFSNLVLPLLLHGIPLILAPSPLPESIRLACDQFPAVTLPGVPALWKVWLEAGVLGDSVRLAISAGAPLSVSLEQAVFEAHGIKVHNFYGSSECGGIAYDDSIEPRSDNSLIGRPMDNVVLGIGDGGCLEVRGAAVGSGYWPEASDTLDAGVFQTSDLAELIEGRIFLRGRAGDLINVAGRKLHPETVERALEQHPGLQHCVVFGVPDADRSEKVVAVVRLRGKPSIEALRQHLQARLPAWQIPKDWWITDELEADARGKVSRSQWRERFLNRPR